MSQIHIYLAGAIAGCTKEEANDWRTIMEDLLFDAPAGEMWSHGFMGVSPLRCEPLTGERYEAEYADNKFGLPQVIAAKNKEDVRRCDVTFAYFPKENPPSVGTLQEIGWASAWSKPIILVTDNDYVRDNAVIKATVPWRFTEEEGGFEKAVEVITGIFGVYS